MPDSDSPTGGSVDTGGGAFIGRDQRVTGRGAGDRTPDAP